MTLIESNRAPERLPMRRWQFLAYAASVAVTTLAAQGVASPVTLSAAQAAQDSTYIGYFGGLAQPRYHRRPVRLQLWLTDAISNLQWNDWASPVATARGRISSHPYGNWSYTPTQVHASRRVICRGRFQYSRLRYIDPSGQWRSARFLRTKSGCGFSA